MSILPILFWVIVALALLGCFWPTVGKFSVPALLVLIVFLGLRVFPVAWN